MKYSREVEDEINIVTVPMVKPLYFRVILKKQTPKSDIVYSNRWVNMPVGKKKAELLNNALNNLLDDED